MNEDWPIIMYIHRTMFLSAQRGSDTSERKVLTEKHDGKEGGMSWLKEEVLRERRRAESTD